MLATRLNYSEINGVGNKDYNKTEFILQNALKFYDQPLNQRSQITKDNLNKSGVYVWINN